MPREFDINIPYIRYLKPGKKGERFKARRNIRNTHWYIWCECQFCNKIFAVIESEIKRGRGRYCSTMCSSYDNNPSGKLNTRWKGGTDTPEKVNCRQQLQRAIADGKLQRQACELCQIFPADAHHDDYTKPFEVVWLCQQHHNQFHNETFNNKIFARTWIEQRRS